MDGKVGFTNRGQKVKEKLYHKKYQNFTNFGKVPVPTSTPIYIITTSYNYGGFEGSRGHMKSVRQDYKQDITPPDNFIEKLSTPPWHVKAKVYE